MGDDLSNEQLQSIYAWVDSIPLSRPKKSITRDFSDGVLVAEIIKAYFPSYVGLHSFPAANNTVAKLKNWTFLNNRVLGKKFDFKVDEKIFMDIVNYKVGAIETFLLLLKIRLEQKKEEIATPSVVTDYSQQSSQKGRGGRQRLENDMPEVDQNMGRTVKGRRGQQKVDIKPPDFERVTHKSLNRSEAQPELGMVPPRGADPIFQKKSQMVLKYEEKVQECLSKEETIQILYAKTRRLEHLISLKDQRLHELQKGVESLRPTGGFKKGHNL